MPTERLQKVLAAAGLAPTPDAEDAPLDESLESFA